MKILADQYLYRLDELIPDGSELTCFDPADGFPLQATEFDALLIRTVTTINAGTLPAPGNLKFIGTATAGFDHLDTNHLEKIGVHYGRSAGCNARAVAEYVITCLYQWAGKQKTDLTKKKIGVVGCGQTGGALITLLKKLNIAFVAYDPPKADTDHTFRSATLDHLLDCDILTFHTPLTTSGNHPTYHLCSKNWLNRKFDLIINAARGGVVNETDLLISFQQGITGNYILDVWENEPLFSNKTAINAFVATPHIAGYSREAKFRASQMVVEEMCRFFNLPKKDTFFSDTVDRNDLKIEEGISFSGFMWQNNQVEQYDTELRKLIGLPENEKGPKFAALRTETPTRFEYKSILKAVGDKKRVPKEFYIFE